MKKSIIATLCHNKWELTNRLLNGLLRHESDSIQAVFVLDNNSSDKTRDGLLEWERDPRVLVLPIFEEKNLGFTIGANVVLSAAIKYAAPDQPIFLVSNDVQIDGKFIEQARLLFDDGRKKLVGNRYIAWNSGWNTFKGKTYDYLEGYFLCTTADGWKELDFFDPNYAPYDYEDIDLSTRAKTLGFRLETLNNPHIIHLGGGTLGYSPEREAVTNRNKKYFEWKWVR